MNGPAMLRTCGSLIALLVLVLGCRAVRNDYDIPAGNDASTGAPDTSSADAAAEPTRLEPPIVHAAPNVSVATMAGSDVPGASDGIAAAAQFDDPVGVSLDTTGSLIVTEYGGGRVRKLSPAGLSTTLATGLVEPFGILATPSQIFVQTDGDPTRQRGDATGTLWRMPLEGGAPQLVLTALGRVRGLVQLFDGRVVFTDSVLRTVSILDLANYSVKVLAGGRAGLVDGRGSNARFGEPYGVAILPDGNLMIADRGNHAIRKLTVDGTVTLYAGDGKPGMKDDVDRLAARFDSPVDVAVDAVGNVFVSDAGNKRIRRISPTGVVETVAGDGTRGFADGVGEAARFYGQDQIDVSPDGKVLFVADGTGDDEKAPYHRIRRITL